MATVLVGEEGKDSSVQPYTWVCEFIKLTILTNLLFWQLIIVLVLVYSHIVFCVLEPSGKCYLLCIWNSGLVVLFCIKFYLHYWFTLEYNIATTTKFSYCYLPWSNKHYLYSAVLFVLLLAVMDDSTLCIAIILKKFIIS